MDRWKIFNLLKNNKIEKTIDEYTPKEIEELIVKTSIQELREGLIEYLLLQMHEEKLRKEKLKK